MATTVFSYTWVLVFGFVATIYNLLLLCMERQSGGLFCGALLCWLVAVLQIVACAMPMDESNLLFCDNNDVDQDSAMCNVALYQAMNVVGAIVWIANGLFIVALPDPEPHNNIRHSRAVAPAKESHVTRQTINSTKTDTIAQPDGSRLDSVSHPDGPISVDETGDEGRFEEDCNV